ncbi:exo-alpha-sialidase [Verrucomicrobiota bacterium]
MKKIILIIAVLCYGVLAEAIDVFVAGKEKTDWRKKSDEPHYCKYREQNVVQTKSGRIVVVCQGRNKSSWCDRSGQDLVVKTSDDNGRTWSPVRLVVTHGNHSICPNAIVYDREKNCIHLLYNLITWDYKNPPHKGELNDFNCVQYTIISNDEGETWSKPKDVSDMVGAGGSIVVFGSGEGIQLEKGKHKGRLIVAGGDFHKGKKVLCFYSDDHGATWKRGNPVPIKGQAVLASETKVAELPDGTIVLNSRTFLGGKKGQRLRSRSYSKDGGVTWLPLENDPAMKTVSCNGSLIAVKHPKGKDGTVLLCSVPVGPNRTHGTIYTSFDNGQTWPVKNMVVPEYFAYSSLLQFADGRIALFYEAEEYKKIKMALFSLDELLEGKHE